VGRFVRERLAALPNEVRPVGRDDDLHAALADADAVVHLAGTLQPMHGNSYEAANVATVERTVAALAGSTVARVVLLSYVGADAGSGNDYLRTKGEAEELVRGCGREAAVLRATFIFGPPDDPGPSAVPFISTDGHAVAVVGDGRQRYAPVYVVDVAEALVRLALDPAAPTGTLALAGPQEIAVDEFVETLSGGHARERHLRRPVARALSHLTPRLTPAMVDVLAADSLADGSRPAAEALGLGLRSLAGTYVAGGPGA
jgi:NADH dehydrogenase